MNFLSASAVTTDMWARDQVDDSRAVTVHQALFISSADSSKSSPSLSLPHIIQSLIHFYRRAALSSTGLRKTKYGKTNKQNPIGMTG